MLSISHVLNAFLLSVVLIPIFSHLAIRVDLIDLPGGRKHHASAVPVVGGITMFLSISLTTVMLGSLFGQYSVFFVGMSLLVIVGVVDDFRDLGAGVKAIAQFIGALIMTIWGGMVVVSLGEAFGTSWSIPVTGIPFTIFCVVGLINALNMIDGVDGLAGGISLSALTWFFLAAMLGGLQGQTMMLAMLIVAVLGFLLYNARSPWRSKASVFMGDAGSMMLGFALAWFAVDLSQAANAVFAPVTVLWILALPTLDALLIFVRRLRRWRSPFHADREHLHHLLQDVGLSPGQTVAVMVSISWLLGGCGLLLDHFGFPESVMLVGFLMLVPVHALVVWQARRKLLGQSRVENLSSVLKPVKLTRVLVRRH